MSTVIYISNKQIQIIAAKGAGMISKPAAAYRLPSPEGSVINGIVMDPDALIAFFKEFFAQSKLSMKDVYLVVNSSKIAGKRIEMPAMNPKKTLDFVSREFNDIDREEVVPVFAYTTLTAEKGSKVKRVYAETVDADFIKDYIDIFNEIGVTLKGIYSSEGTMIKMIEQTAGKRGRTFVVQIADDNILTNVLWVDGSFYYYSSQRCFSDPGTGEYMEECVRSLSQLTQFMKANQVESPIENIYVGGMENLDLNTYQILTQSSRIEANVEYFDCGLSSKVGQQFDLTTVLPALAGLFGQEKTSNMLANYSVRKSDKQVDAFWKKSFILIGSVAFVMIVLTAVAIFAKLSTSRKLDEVKEYNESPAVQMQLASYDFAVQTIAKESDRYASYKNIKNAVETYPIFNDSLIYPIEQCAAGYATIEITSFDAVAGILSFTANSKKVDDINKFVARLQGEPIFSSVSYTGYSLNSTDNTWDIHVSCTLAESAGR